MAKRFTETTKWGDPWYRKLELKYKVFWQYLLDNCDNAGVWVKDIELASFYIEQDLQEENILKALNNGKERIRVLEDREKWFILQFVRFQYGELSDKCKPHLQVMQLLEKHRVSIPLTKGNVRDKDKDKDKDNKGSLGIGKDKYLEFVYLTKDEYQKLVGKFTGESAKEYIERLNNYIGSKGKLYKSHYHTILAWANKDKQGEEGPNNDPQSEEEPKMRQL